MTPLVIAAAGAVLFAAMDAALRFGRESRQLGGAPADRGTTRDIYFALGAIVIAVFVLPRLVRLDGAALPWARAWSWIGAAMVPAGFSLRLWATLTLRHAYSRTLRVQAGQDIVRRGPYARVRHPGYLGSLVLWSGIALSSGNAIPPAVALLGLGAAYSRRIRHEEAMLREAFGERYAAYARETGALWPGRGPRGADRSPGA
jgi:protein-S-isoprenylcysteine O-methyltransferase Ste14